MEVCDSLPSSSHGEEAFFPEGGRPQDSASRHLLTRPRVRIETDRHAKEREPCPVEGVRPVGKHDIALIEELRVHSVQEQRPSLLHLHICVRALKHPVQEPGKAVCEISNISAQVIHKERSGIAVRSPERRTGQFIPLVGKPNVRYDLDVGISLELGNQRPSEFVPSFILAR